METEKTAASFDSNRANAARRLDGRDGLVGTMFTLSLGLVESSVRTSANVARTIVGEAQKLAESAIALQEQATQGAIRTAREVSRAGLELATDAINRAETAAVTGLAHGQKTSDRMAELAAQATSAAVGSRGLGNAAQA